MIHLSGIPMNHKPPFRVEKKKKQIKCSLCHLSTAVKESYKIPGQQAKRCEQGIANGNASASCLLMH